jgi:succinoglycan biosynthesis transport protein ExoP
MPIEYQLSPRDYLAIARRWALAMILTFGTVLAGSVVVALMLPRVYESSGTLLAEAPRFTGDIASAGRTMNAEQRVQAVGRRIMTRENLLQIAAAHDVFESGDGPAMRDNDVVGAMRASIGINVLGGLSSGWERPTNNFTFAVSFQHGNPEKAFEVTNALIQLFLESSVRQSVDQAARANEFLNQEADRVKAQLEDLERQIAAYKRAQGGVAAGEGQVVTLANIQTLESDLRAAERDHRSALNELRTLEVDLAGARAGLLPPGTVPAQGPSPTEVELERAKAEFARIRGIYTDDHPDVRRQQRQIELLERAARAEASASTPAREAAAGQTRLATSRLEAQIATARARADLLVEQQRNLRSSIAQQRSQLARAPQVERDLAALLRDYDAAKAQYEDLRSKQMSAQVVQNLEGEQQGDRFTLFEPPLLAEYPIKPNRKKLVAAGFVAALVAAAGIALSLETLFSRVRGINAVTALTGQRPMAVIPYISTSVELQSMKLLRKRLVIAMVVSGLGIVVLFHTLVMPLQNLLVTVFSRLG